MRVPISVCILNFVGIGSRIPSIPNANLLSVCTVKREALIVLHLSRTRFNLTDKVIIINSYCEGNVL